MDWFKLADAKLPEETHIVLGLSGADMVRTHNLFPNRVVHFVDLGEEEIRTDLTQRITGPQTGPIMILPVVDYLGYQEINLIGCDMNRLATFGKQIENFYEQDPGVNATDPCVWGNIIDTFNCEMNALKQFKGFYDHFAESGKQVYNLSPVSWINFIEKRDFEEQLKG